MKKYLYILIIAGAAVLAGFVLYASLLKVSPRPEVDNAAVNEIAKQASLYWKNIDFLDGTGFAYRFFIVDNDGIVRYSSSAGMPDSFQTAVRQGFLPIDVVVGAGIAGKALVEVYPGGYINEAQINLSISALVAFTLLSLLTVAVLLAFHRSVIRPFMRLESFAHRLSTGKFDEPLPMDRNNMFGLFSQSFYVMRASLLEAQQKQISAERAKKELIASLNHDIKTPVTSIKLTSELLQAGGDITPAIAEKLRVIDAKANQISRLMNDMLQSALEELVELNINISSRESEIMRDVINGADPLFKTRIGAIPPCLIELDAARMEQVVGNIISNSYKYAGTDINISFEILDGFLHVYICDQGDGVAPEELELICTKFYRGVNAKASRKGGEGLGLYIARQLMAKMGGGLEAFNRDGGFCIRLWLCLSS